MDLTIQQLRMLREVAHRGTIAAAADGLGYTASAVSQQLSAIERSTGVAVLERVGRNVQLTDAGRQLVSHADVMLAELERARASLERVQSDPAGVIRVGLSESVAGTIVPTLLRLAAEHYPALEIHTREFPEGQGIDAVRSGELDACFVLDTATRNGLGVALSPVCNDWFHLIVPVDDDTPEGVSFKDLQGRCVIAAPRNESCGRTVRDAYAKDGLELDVQHQIDDYPATLTMVAAGVGIGYVSDLGLSRVPDGVRIVDVAKPFFRLVELAYRESSAERPAIQALLHLMEITATELQLDRSFAT